MSLQDKAAALSELGHLQANMRYYNDCYSDGYDDDYGGMRMEYTVDYDSPLWIGPM